jgi:methionyl aminopeptidase
MVVMGRRDVVQLEDNWTIVTVDRMPAAHFEHTVAVSETGADILTDGRPSQPVPEPATGGAARVSG